MGTLTEAQLKKLADTPPRKMVRMWDGGGGLYAQVSPNGVISFWMKYRHREPDSKVTKERADSIGRWGRDSDKGEITLSIARNRVREALLARAKGKDPRKIEFTGAEVPRERITFREAAQAWIDHLKREGAESTAAQVRYIGECNEVFGDKPPDDVTVDDVSIVLAKYRDARKYESEKRCRIAAGQAFKFAIAVKQATTNPVAAYVELKRKSPKPARSVRHHAAMDVKDIPALLKKLDGAPNLDPSVRLGLRFLVLSLLRTSEVRELRRDDVSKDFKQAVIPAERMKNGQPHVVFLSRQAQDTLREMWKFSEGRELAFPGRDPSAPMSRMSFLMTLRRMKAKCTAHGFRSSFSTHFNADPANERVVERILAHSTRGEVQRAYDRNRFDAQARKLWEKWANLVAP